MSSLLNPSRPPVFCPGCSHERITHALDHALVDMELSAEQVAIVTDIGCSGLFDTFFHTHAMHGLHGRALTYATGLKLARPNLQVVVTMGDGGQGIGGAHLLAACRRNLNLTLLILNNFNFGMTGGQYSATTPPDARVGSAFLNQLERALDICQVAQAAGAPYVRRCSGLEKNLAGEIRRAMEYEGFAVLDIWGICPGRFTQKNRLTPKMIAEGLAELPQMAGPVTENQRREYADHYRESAAGQKKAPPPAQIDAQFDPPQPDRREVILLGDAGQRVITCGEILCLAGLFAGLRATQKNEYDITVLRGPSISELVLSPDEIDFTGIHQPDIIVALGQEGVNRRKDLFAGLGQDTLIIQIEGIELPANDARVSPVDLKSQGIKPKDWALGSLAVLAKLNQVIHMDMLRAALRLRFKETTRETALELVERAEIGSRV